VAVTTEAAASMLRRLAAGDAQGLATDLQRRSEHLLAAGATLEEAFADGQMLVEAAASVLDAAGLPRAAVLEARVALDALQRTWMQLQVCLWTRAGQSDEVCAQGPSHHDGLCGIVGRSAPMQELFARIEAAARWRDTVLIVGETGTGKELVARAIHVLSGDPPERFIAVNCAGLPRELMESEFFGHRPGAFTGATGHQGLVRAAHGGSLFLDEITELTAEAQAKLLRVLQEKAVRPVGDTRELTIDVRMLAATNADPAALVEQGRLRRDLFYRLQRIVLVVPPLRERPEDLPLLVEHFVRRWQLASRAPGKTFSVEALDRLAEQAWPGNVRELENLVCRACSTVAGPEVRAGDLPDLLGAPRPADPAPAATKAVSLRDAERTTILRALQEAAGNKSLAARILGISRKQLYVKLRDYAVE
jgi:transcriptional regulator with PAS, ATPase and Fis domain